MAYNPTWQKHEKGILDNDPKVASESADRFEAERNKELKNDPAARRFEKERKAEIKKNKPLWKKEQLKKNKAEYNHTLEKYLDGGVIMGKFIPSPGFMLIKPIIEQETKGGLILPEGVGTDPVGSPSRGVVVACGKDKLFTNGSIVEAPAKVGDKIMMKWHTMEMMYEGEKHNFVSFEDVFGVLK